MLQCIYYVSIRYVFNVYGSVHRKNILIYVQQDATLHSLFYLETRSTCTITHHQERKKIVSMAFGIWHTVTATCRYRGGVGTAEQLAVPTPR
jgi:hypothetical protein